MTRTRSPSPTFAAGELSVSWLMHVPVQVIAPPEGRRAISAYSTGPYIRGLVRRALPALPLKSTRSRHRCYRVWKRWAARRGKAMSDTQVLVGRIAALRAAPGPVGRAGRRPGQARRSGAPSGRSAAHDAARRRRRPPVDGRRRGSSRGPPETVDGPARRVLERGRELLAKLRNLADVFPFVSGDDGPGDLTAFERTDPLAVLYRETAAMTDASLRLVAMFPDTATAQMQLCEGVESMLQRCRAAHGYAVRRRRASSRRGQLRDTPGRTAGRSGGGSPSRVGVVRRIGRRASCRRERVRPVAFSRRRPGATRTTRSRVTA